MDDAPALPADLSNWRTQPFNRWAFQHVGALIATAEIANDPARIWSLPRAPRSFGEFQLRTGASELDWARFLEATATDGIMVLYQGRIVHETYANGLSEHGRHIIMSASKSVTGLIAAMLEAEGLLSFDAWVSDYIPEVAGSAFAGATVRHLLDMRTGVILNPAELQAYAAATNWDPTEQPSDLHNFLAVLGPAARAHGGPFAYISANTDLMGWVLERVSGERFADLVSRLLWKPLGAVDAAAITLDPAGAPRTTGGVCMTLRDFARLGQLLVQNGRRDGDEIVPLEAIEDIAHGGDAEAWKTGEFAGGFGGSTMRYRTGWYVIDDAPQTLFAMGIHGQHLFVDRANQLVVAKLSSLNDPIDPRAISLTHRAVVEIRRILSA